MKSKLRWFHVAIMIYMLEMDVNIFSNDRIAAENIGSNYWIGVFLLGLITFAHLYFITVVIRQAKGRSIFDILETSVPKPILYVLYAGLVMLWICYSSTMGSDYALIYQYFSFQSRNTMLLLLMFTIIVYYLLIQSIQGIFRAMTIFFLLVVWLPLLLLYFIPDWSYLRMTSFLFKGTTEAHTFYSWLEVYQVYSGYEMVLILIPFLDQRGDWIKGVYVGQAFVWCTYICSTIMISGYFSLGQLQEVTYPVLNILSYIELPFLNRVEILTFTLFVFNSIAKTVIYCFAALQIMQRVFPAIKAKLLTLGIICCLYGCAWMFQLLRQSEQWYKYLNYSEMSFSFSIPFILMLLLFIQRASMKGSER